MTKSNTFALSRADQIREIVRCGKDPEYFIKRYVKIQHPTKGIIPFTTYPFQDDCLRDFQKHRLNIVLKSRQLGLSTITAAFATWMSIFQKDKNILIIATKLPTAINFIKKVKVILDSLPSWLLLPKVEPTKQQISFSNGSTIKAIPTSDDAGRSEALSLLIIDEAAFIRDFDSIWTGLAPTFSTGGRAIILSTPNGSIGQYYTLWTDAINGQNEFNPIKIMWYQHPEHDQDWFNKETRGLSKKTISQEYLCDFLSSGDTFLQADVLDELRQQVSQPIEKQGRKQDIWIWKHPEVDKSYVLAADVARGDAQDFSTFNIIDESTCEVVVEYMGKLAPEKFAELIFEWGTKYNLALAAIENNTFGYFVNTKLRDRGYKYLYYMNCRGDQRTYIPASSEELPGFSTSQKSRVQILSKLEEMLRNKKLVSHSQRFYEQLGTFVWINNKPQAASGNHDDIIMSLAIASWLVEGTNQTFAAKQIEMSYAILNATSVEKRTNNALGGINQVQPINSIRGRMNQYVSTTPRPASCFSNRFDFSWLHR